VGKKRPVHKADNLPPSWAVVTKSGSVNFLEPSGPVTGLLYLNFAASPKGICAWQVFLLHHKKT